MVCFFSSPSFLFVAGSNEDGKHWLTKSAQATQGWRQLGKAIPSVDAAKKIADAFEVSLDYLVGEGVNASFDKQTVQRLQQIQTMDDDSKSSLFSIIDAVIRDYKTRKAYAS